MTEAGVNKKALHPLQSWQWGEFRKEWGNTVLRTKHGQITATPIPHTSLKVATFLKGARPTATMLRDLKKLSKEEGLISIKLEPNMTRNKSVEKLLKDKGAVRGKTLFTPTTFWIDLTKGEDEMLKGFHSKTRYNIRYAERKGVEVAEDNSPKAFEKYIALTRETVERQGFYAHSENYHRLMWKHLHTNMVKNKKKPIARLLTARVEDEIVTTWIVFVWKKFLYYPYGASTDKHKNLQANSLMMWEAIKYGKKLGLTTFDLWGRKEDKGFTKFKEGFNQKVVEF